jgi:sterol desaturase/sphingolipid hydroxylase (fatty acid hydroxylase superfamily)
MTTSSPSAATVTAVRPRSTTLSEEARTFWRHRNPRIEASVVVGVLVARSFAGSWTTSDALIIAGVLAAQPLVEWLIHVFVLHYRPITIRGRTIDFELARKHREHHADPTDVDLIFVPWRSLVKLIPLTGALLLVVLPSPATALTVMAGAATMLLAYEWTHYLIHSRYRPKSRLFRYISRAHRLHHYKNEQYWFGVTNPTADHLLRTFPDPTEVETSPTARNLHGVG